jgi:hypothetical protein
MVCRSFQEAGGIARYQCLQQSLIAGTRRNHGYELLVKSRAGAGQALSMAGDKNGRYKSISSE